LLSRVFSFDGGLEVRNVVKQLKKQAGSAEIFRIAFQVK
jgi:hypothetical protein